MLKTRNLILGIILAAAIALALVFVIDINAQERYRQLFIAYPPAQHQTTSDRIFLIGTAPKNGEVLVNGKSIKRSPAGHFAPTFPLQLGENRFNLKHHDQNLNLRITRLPKDIAAPTSLGFIKDSLIPNVNIARQPNELICFEAIATANVEVKVKVGKVDLALFPKTVPQLPANSAILTGDNQPYSEPSGRYQGCTSFAGAEKLGKPEFVITQGHNVVKQSGNGAIEILSPDAIEVAEVVVEAGVARTGASSDFSRLTPLPKGTKDRITAKQGDWVRLSYGGWIDNKSIQIFPSTPSQKQDAKYIPNSIVRSLISYSGSY